MTREDFERLLDMTLLDGVLTQQEQSVLIQRASELGITPDELQIMIDAKMQEKQLNAQKEQNAATQNQMLYSTLVAVAQNSSKGSARPTKCPHCGAPVELYSSRCAQCGNEIPTGDDEPSGVNIAKFSEMMTTAKTLDERLNVIAYTAVPATKKGLLDFATFAIGQLRDINNNAMYTLDERPKMRSAWMAKLVEIGSKAEIVLKDDNKTKSTIDGYVAEAKAIIAVTKRNGIIYLVVKALFILLGILYLYTFIFQNASDANLFSTIIFFVLAGAVWKKKLVTKFLPL